MDAVCVIVCLWPQQQSRLHVRLRLLAEDGVELFSGRVGRQGVYDAEISGAFIVGNVVALDAPAV